MKRETSPRRAERRELAKWRDIYGVGKSLNGNRERPALKSELLENGVKGTIERRGRGAIPDTLGVHLWRAPGVESRRSMEQGKDPPRSRKVIWERCKINLGGEAGARRVEKL